MMSRQLKKSIIISFLFGAPIGILAFTLTIFIPSFLSGHTLNTILLLGYYGKSIIGLLLSFTVALWIGGKLAFKCINHGNSLIVTSFKYSAVINLIIWFTFIFIVLLTFEDDKILMIIPPIISFIISTILSTFTIGLLVSSEIRNVIK